MLPERCRLDTRKNVITAKDQQFLGRSFSSAKKRAPVSVILKCDFLALPLYTANEMPLLSIGVGLQALGGAGSINLCTIATLLGGCKLAKKENTFW